MSNRMGMALVGIGPGAVPHLRSLHDLRDGLELRHAVTRRPERADMGPFQGVVSPTSDLQAALTDPLVQAVIVATPPSVDGEATALLLARELSARGVTVSRIASGVPHGGELEFADQITLGRAIEGRRNLDSR